MNNSNFNSINQNELQLFLNSPHSSFYNTPDFGPLRQLQDKHEYEKKFNKDNELYLKNIHMLYNELLAKYPEKKDQILLNLNNYILSLNNDGLNLALMNISQFQ